MEIGITVPLQKFLGWDRPPYGECPDPFFCWDAHRAEIQGRKLLVVADASNRFAAVRRMSGSDWKDLGSAVPDAIDRAMAQAGIPSWARQRYFDAAAPAVFTKTHGKKPVGCLNRVVDDVWFAVGRDWELESMFQAKLTALANGAIARCATRKGYVEPREAFLENLDLVLNEGAYERFLEESAGGSSGRSNVIPFPGPATR